MKNKKVVLVYPKFLTGISKFNIPLSLLHLGSFIESKKYKVKVIDGNIEKNYIQLLLKEAKNAVAVGFSVMTNQIPEARKTALILKKEFGQKIPLIFGGAHPTLFPKQTIGDPLVDFSIVGEGEISFHKLLIALEKKTKLTSLKGVGLRKKNGQFFYHPQDKIFNFEKLPLINYGLLNPKIIFQFSNYFIGMLTSRGCPHCCSFCINTVITQNRLWRSWKAKRVIKEIKNLKQNYGVDKIFFWDENFFVNKKRVNEILDLLEKENLKIKWFANIRADYFQKNFINDRFLKKLRKNGCLKFGIGAESGSQHMLNIYNKKIAPQQILFSAKQCHKFNITPTYSFMIGAPGETNNDIRKTIDIFAKIIKLCPKAHILGPQLFRPYPGSSLYKKCLLAGWKEPQTLVQWEKVILNQFMETDLFNSPWIKNPEFVNIAWFYSLFLVIPTQHLLCFFWEYCRITKEGLVFILFGTLGVFGLSFFGKLRYKFNFYHLPYEVQLLKKFRSILSA